MDDKQRIALVETKTTDISVPASSLPETLIRYQFGNHLGSASLELDDNAQIISYEEYTPYGSTSYQAVRSQTETPKRYRYTGKERDEESGLYYHGARYYAPWLGRWTATDPAGIKTATDLYPFTSCNPVRYTDPTGLADVEVTIPTFRGQSGLQNADALIQQTFQSGIAPKGGASAPQTLENLLESINVSSAKSGFVQSSQSADVATGFATSGGTRGGVVFEILPRPDSIAVNWSPIADKIAYPEQRIVAHPGGVEPQQVVRAIIIPKGAEDVVRVIENPNSVLAAPQKLLAAQPVEPAPASTSATTAAPATDVFSTAGKISSLLDRATPGAAKVLTGAAVAYAAYDISTKTEQTTREKGAVMGVAQFGKTTAKHATAMLWFAVGATVAVSIASGGAASPLAAAAIGALIVTAGTTATHSAIAN